MLSAHDISAGFPLPASIKLMVRRMSERAHFCMESIIREMFDSSSENPAVGLPLAEKPSVMEGYAAIVRMQHRLAALASDCGQAGAADFIHFFLTQPYTGDKVPTLILFSQAQKQVSWEEAPLSGAVLVHQYRKFGFPLGIYVSEDTGGERNVIAPARQRSMLAVSAMRYLMAHRRARLVALTLKDASLSFSPGNTHSSWASTSRSLHRYLPLQNSYEATLNTFGSHTRRNFRLYRRRAEASMGCVFTDHADLSEADFIALNTVCDYEVPLRVAQWRYRSTHEEPGGVFAGLRAADGTWLSILGGRRYHGTFALDWQMNRTQLSQYSPSTLMRGYLMENEIALGTRHILFEGGTPHPMNSAFLQEEVTDLLSAASPRWMTFFARYAHRILPEKNFLSQTLSDASLRWHNSVTG
jgi:hypothetical protein